MKKLKNTGSAQLWQLMEKSGPFFQEGRSQSSSESSEVNREQFEEWRDKDKAFVEDDFRRQLQVAYFTLSILIKLIILSLLVSKL